MTFQETHVSDNILSLINTQFQAQHSLWSRHYGIVSFSPSFVFSTNLAPENDRTILTKVTHPHNAFALSMFLLYMLQTPLVNTVHSSLISYLTSYIHRLWILTSTVLLLLEILTIHTNVLTCLPKLLYNGFRF
ncbi:hypothetical protein G6F62_013617 [Rhizopus arrhizus]|uniref:Uncharacterized protein n=1 Tax=Rhizopus oryzae TaxID=64495 RepID=A0A9P7BK54_RHIOR|nr:hypothetical protein G6F22_017533 [Rhizopus arrhizus]KAG0776176.1 hypothetical protein G6F21_013723 [Rhizopus arrhizus]KAG0929423.1 hypothetical protein G6F31_017356 [Rhizopus arrhizus]KAG1178404.1 hypothetical protein G6F35_016309 [Rhizopus arrhizus]KAG1270472.1 hypothetical protein G6F66_013806 [Rhizopus arrhizus]